MSYTTISDGMVDVDSPVNTTLMQALRDNARELRLQVFHVSVDASDSTASYKTVDTLPVYIPNFPAESGWTESLVVRVNLSSGSGSDTAYFRISDNSSGDTSTEASTTQTTGTAVDVTLSIDSSWKGTTRDIDFEIKNSAGGTDTIIQMDGMVGRLYY